MDLNPCQRVSIACATRRASGVQLLEGCLARSRLLRQSLYLAHSSVLHFHRTFVHFESKGWHRAGDVAFCCALT